MATGSEATAPGVAVAVSGAADAQMCGEQHGVRADLIAEEAPPQRNVRQIGAVHRVVQWPEHAYLGIRMGPEDQRRAGGRNGSTPLLKVRGRRTETVGVSPPSSKSSRYPAPYR